MFADEGEGFSAKANLLSREEGDAFLTVFATKARFDVADGFAGTELIENMGAHLFVSPHMNIDAAGAENFGSGITRHVQVAVVYVQIAIVLEGLKGHWNRARFESFGEALFRKAQLVFRLAAFGDFLGEPFVGNL